MTFEEFLSSVSHALTDISQTINSDSYETKVSHGLISNLSDELILSVANYQRIDEVQPESFIVTAWETGGYSGGSCWDDSNPTPYSVDIKCEDLVLLDKILEVLCPSITFLQYKRLDKDVPIRSGDMSISEYYGNCTDYAYKAVDLLSLYQWLVKNDLFQ
jgi:hypothetical protein